MGIIIRQSFKASLSNYIGVLIGFLSLVYFFPKFFNPSELGAVRLLIELGAIIGAFGLFGTTYSINRFFPYFKNPPKHHGFFFWIFLIPLIGFTLILINYIWFKADFILFFKAGDSALIHKIYPMLLLLIMSVMGQMILESASANHGRIAIPNFLREVYVRIVIFIGALAYFLGFISFDFACWITVFAYFSAFLGNLFYLRSLTPIYIKPDFTFLKQHPTVKKDALKFTLWLFLSSSATLFITKVDFLMISATKSLADTAIYSIGFYIAVLIEIPKRNILQIATPIIATHSKNKNLSELQILFKQIANMQFLLGGLLFLVIWTNIDTLFSIMPNGDFYKTGKFVVLIIGLNKVIELLLSAVSPVINNSNFYFWNFATSMVAIFSAVYLNYVLIPIYGINGAATATLITTVLLYGLSVLIVYLNWKIHPFSKKMWLSTLLLIAGVAISMIPVIGIPSFLFHAIQTLVIASLYLLAILKTNIAPEAKPLIEKYLGKN